MTDPILHSEHPSVAAGILAANGQRNFIRTALSAIAKDDFADTITDFLTQKYGAGQAENIIAKMQVRK